MLKGVIINVKLGIKGPILCKSTFSSAWGVDATFDRDHKGIPYIDRSHLKGKLREALNELGVDKIKVKKWLGKEGNEAGMIVISNFYFSKNKESVRYDNRLTRIKIDRKRGVVKEGALMYAENLFPPQSKPYLWKGTIEFIANDGEVDYIVSSIKAGLKWITAIGAEKTVGFGRIVSVETNVDISEVTIPRFNNSKSSDDWLTIIIKPKEPMLIGGVKRATNYLESESIITGAMIKGALTETLNNFCGTSNPRSTPIDEKNQNVYKYFPELCKHFSQIRFTHAFPTLASSKKRPVVIPYSAVEAEGLFYDVALAEKVQLINGKAPLFQTDWKNYPANFGWANPHAVVKTRTAIDESLRRAEEEKLFTYQYVCPFDSDGKEITWVSFARLPKKFSNNSNRLIAELVWALENTTLMGKRKSKVEIKVEYGRWESALSELSTSQTNYIITLQSDALMVNPCELLKDQTAATLFKLYNEYWQQVSSNSLELRRFFAHQKMLGGFLVARHKGSYYPFFLTRAGSVFVLESKNNNVSERIAKWQNEGLPIPDWAQSKYKLNGKEFWETCPFIPENGYGEIMVNLNWHFVRDISKAGGER